MQTKAIQFKTTVKSIVQKIRRSGRRQKLTMLSAVFVVYVLTLAGIFSYFHSEDKVTNRLTAPQGSVTIQEPNWDSTGQTMAKISEPGMSIPKDPSGVNNGQVDVYIRLKMTIRVDQLKNCKMESPPSFSDRLTAIANAIRLDSKDSNDRCLPLFYTDNGELKTHNTNFILDGIDDSNLKELVFYFYYTGGDANMKIVKPEEATDALFDHIDIPIYKKDYLGIFDQPYDIILTAEGIPVGNNTVLSEADAKSQFP